MWQTETGRVCCDLRLRLSYVHNLRMEALVQIMHACMSRLSAHFHQDL